MTHFLDKKIGILGGGQLGKMLVQAGSKIGFDITIMDKTKDYPTPRIWPKFTSGDFTKYADVMAFGQDKDIITVEIENVNTQALHDLQAQGKKVFPQPAILETIKDKGLQKQFYKLHEFQSSDFSLYGDKNDVLKAIEEGDLTYPFVQKSRTEGYDGKGVAVIKNEADLTKLIDAPCLTEDLVDIDKELAVIVVRNENGEIKSFPTVEMLFHPTANLVEYLICPAQIGADYNAQAKQISEALATKLGIVGLLAVELFLTKEGYMLINEVAPRPHNSGHHTIEANVTSQYEQHLRAICRLPLGETDLKSPAAMANLLGEDGHHGTAIYENLNQCLSVNDSHIHLYGKTDTKPFRKMGHVTCLGKDVHEAIKKAKFVCDTLKIKA